MKAETAYSVVQALPTEELARLYAMLDQDRKPDDRPKVKNTVVRHRIWTVEECTEHLWKALLDSRAKRLAKKEQEIKNTPSNCCS